MSCLIKLGAQNDYVYCSCNFRAHGNLPHRDGYILSFNLLTISVMFNTMLSAQRTNQSPVVISTYEIDKENANCSLELEWFHF